jgi:hypothetical protein
MHYFFNWIRNIAWKIHPEQKQTVLYFNFSHSGEPIASLLKITEASQPAVKRKRKYLLMGKENRAMHHSRDVSHLMRERKPNPPYIPTLLGPIHITSDNHGRRNPQSVEETRALQMGT